MDASLLLHCPTVSATSNPNLKRPCSSSLPDATRIPIPNPLDWLLESLLELPDSSAVALDLSVDRILQSRPYDSDKDDVIDRAFRLGLALTEAANRSSRRRASMHNAVVWALPLISLSSFVEEPMTSSDNDMNLPSLIGSHTSEGSPCSFSPEPSYNSDQSSGNEDNVGPIFALHAEIADDVDYL